MTCKEADCDCSETTCSCCEEGGCPSREEPEGAAKYDATRAARMKILEKVDKLLEKATKGAKTNRKEMIFAIREMYNLCAAHEGVLQALMEDVLQIARMAGVMDRNGQALSLTLGALYKAIGDKGLLTEEEILAAWKATQEEVKEDMAKEVSGQVVADQETTDASQETEPEGKTEE